MLSHDCLVLVRRERGGENGGWEEGRLRKSGEEERKEGGRATEGEAEKIGGVKSFVLLRTSCCYAHGPDAKEPPV